MSQPAEVPSTRLVVDNETVRQELGLLGELAGTWTGHGFNLIARPNFKDKANLYLQLNQTRETLKMTSIGSVIPNRGFGQDDIALHGLSYLDQIEDRTTGGALHLEPGLWITQPATRFPPEQPPADPPKSQIIARMASIPHGNSVLAQGNATTFTGPPTLASATAQYAGSVFPSFNSTPFGAGPPGVINAAGSSENATAAQIPGAVAFAEYDLTVNDSITNPRTPFGTNPPEPLPSQINGQLMQDVVNDPIRLLQAVISKQVASGHTFEGTVLNIATSNPVTFRQNVDSPPSGPTVNIPVTDAASGGIGNTLFLDGETLAVGAQPPAPAPNAQTSLVYATFWIEKVTPPSGPRFMQLQYAQMTVLNFPIFTLLNPPAGGTPALVNLGWPHISVATLRKSFN